MFTSRSTPFILFNQTLVILLIPRYNYIYENPIAEQAV